MPLETSDVPSCPYCTSTAACPHLLLLADLTFRTADGGLLAPAFNERWERLQERADDDFDEAEAFNTLLQQVDDLANASEEYDHEGGPGQSSAMAVYFAQSTQHAQDALASFVAGDDELDDMEGERCPLCGASNHPPADDYCKHNVAWRWDGDTQSIGNGKPLQRAWSTLCERAYAAQDEPDGEQTLNTRAEQLPHGARLLELARDYAGLDQVLEELADAVTGEGWSTGGMMGGSGYSLYVPNPDALQQLTRQCERLGEG